MTEPRLALVAMPFFSVRSPSLQLGLLGAVARAHGSDARTFHFNLDFAALIGERAYESLCDFGRQPVGDWLFSPAAFGPAAPDPGGRLLDDHPDQSRRLLRQLGWTRGQLLEARTDRVPRYLERLTTRVDWSAYDVVGFTSTFQQNVASLALARRIREVAPDALIVVGGANTEDVMGLELLRVAPWVDLIVVGEADETLPDLLAAVGAGRDPAQLPGVAGRRRGRPQPAVPRPLFTQLDESPVPDYGEYFDRAQALGLLDAETRTRVSVPIESSRGCWWGEKHHCTFCGLNGGAMPYRAKSPERTEKELDTLADRHGVRSFAAVDNILDPRYLRTLLPRLARRTEPYDLFFEVKANLRRDDIRLLVQAGVTAIQPGIESLSSRVLELMGKGVQAAQNVDLLRWCHHYGITVHWNMLMGFPGESPEDYQQQAALLPALRHLPPPRTIGRVWMERFSPLFRDRDTFPAEVLVPQAGYRYVYPVATDLRRIAYFFDYRLERTLHDEAFEDLEREVVAWQEAWRGVPPRLECETVPAGILVSDSRDPDDPRCHRLEGPTAEVFTLLMDGPATRAGLRRRLQRPSPPRLLDQALEALAARRLVIDDGHLLVAVAIPKGVPAARRDVSARRVAGRIRRSPVLRMHRWLDRHG